MIGNFLGNFENRHSNAKTAVATFRQLLETFGLFFNPTSGHTAADDNYVCGLEKYSNLDRWSKRVAL